jgi:predicted nucleotide-binding protein
MSLSAIIAKLNDLIDEGTHLENIGDFNTWSHRTYQFLRGTFGQETAEHFRALRQSDGGDWWIAKGRQVGTLEALSASRQEADAALEAHAVPPSNVTVVSASKRVFVVHGHDSGAKETVARYLDRLGLEPVILHEQPNEGRTAIEKFELHSDVGFAVILLTPDDVGASKATPADLKPRARQNVILELGYFLGKLKRSRVCALYTPGVEIPTDYQGVLWIELDDKGAWRLSLAQELSNARLPIDVKRMLEAK